MWEGRWKRKWKGRRWEGREGGKEGGREGREESREGGGKGERARVHGRLVRDSRAAQHGKDGGRKWKGEMWERRWKRK